VFRTVKNFRKSRKDISPIFTTLILIAIAVIAGVVVYMFTSGMLTGMTGGGTAGQEKMAIQAVSYESVTGITLYAQSLTGSSIELDSALIRNAAGVVQSNEDLSAADPIDSTLTEITIPFTPTEAGSYSVTLVTVNGNNFVSSSFTAAP
jgi:flagellin-like protein